MARNLPSTPIHNFIDMRRAFGTKISLGLCSYFFVCTIGHCLLGEFHGTMAVKNPSEALIFLGGDLVSASAGAPPPLCGIVHGLLGRNSRVYGGYEFVIFLFSSPHPLCFIAFCSPFFGGIAPFWKFPNAMKTTSFVKSLPNYYFYC